ncbi:PREDICTED: V-type proton ATPase subunit H-like [Branchiostoma belcheri]|uniref:V-type proton ATPase subunit H n=1 Tax=Branchiostoma belcheri TaxID=7741 RepID=A0A6P4Z8A0_BRABE|nr:PREDICTED: V-type proton ATPase subunit H-like [Branchiostoma belcheri]KAI8506109.1 V-type proton ATPase subunit H [Branchiostoma belcheri]
MSSYQSLEGVPSLAKLDRAEEFKGAGGFIIATDPLSQRAADVRAHRVNWQSYLQGQMISQEDFQFIREFDNVSAENREKVLQDKGMQAVKTFQNLMGKISKDQTVQYILTMVDDMLQEKHDRVNLFFDYAKKMKTAPWSQFINMLNRQDQFVINQAARIIAKLACWGRELMEGSDLTYFFTWLKNQLVAKDNDYRQTVAGCLMMMLRINEYRLGFMRLDGINTLVTVVAANKIGFQLQYQITFSMWLLAFNAEIAMQMDRYNVIPVLSDVLRESVKEKVTRIVLATFRNLLEKPTDRDCIKDHALAMIQCKVLKHLEVLEGQKFEDPDITEDIEFLEEKLQESMQDLSSFDEYSSEVRSGRLEWSPVHKSEKFWRENAGRLNEKNYELLKILIRLLETSKDPQILAVASHDIGEYVRHLPRGKHLIETLGGKQLVMQHMHHEDQSVRYQALLAVQKLMVHNWEYLGKQLQAA